MSRANPRFHRTNATLQTLATTAVRSTFFYQCDQQICLWTLDWVGNSNTYSSAGFELAMATSLNGSLNATIRSLLAADCFFTAIKVASLTTPNRMPGTFQVPSGSQPGSAPGNHIPLEMAAICAKQTAVKGQHGRGRLYLPGIPSSMVTPATDANRLNAAWSTAVAAFLSTLIGLTYTDGANVYSPGLTQRVGKGLPVTQGQSLVSVQARLLLGTVRRRRIGRGK